MKMTLVLLAACIEFTASAQLSLTQPQPAMQVIPNPTIPAGTPALSAPVPPLPAAPLAAGTPMSTNLSAVATLLLNLQTATEDLLPWLTNLNNSFDPASVRTTASGFVGTGTPGAAFQSNFSLALSSNLLAQATAGSGAGTSNVPPNAFPLPAGFANSVQSRDTVRALLMLQNDLERLLPTLAALNGNTNAAIAPGLVPGFVPGAFTNIFGGVVFGP